MAKKRSQSQNNNEAEPSRGLSITNVVIGMVVVIALFGWGSLACSYDAAHAEFVVDETMQRAPRRGAAIRLLILSVAKFVGTSITRIPDCFSVIGWHLQNRIWLPILILSLMGVAVLSGFGLKAMEGVADDPYKKLRDQRGNQMTGPPAKPKKKRKRKRLPPP